MLNQQLIDKLRETIAVLQVHHQRMKFARNNLSQFFPLSLNTYEILTPEQISFTDQLIYRFSKLQDLMGRKLFVFILQGLGEDTENIPFIDILNRLEKLSIMADPDQWLELRETRNLVTHEYPYHQDEYVEGLNALYNQSLKLSEIYSGIIDFTEKRFDL
jgi:hypothetical protein